MTKLKLEHVKVVSNTKIKTAKGFFAQCQRCENWIPLTSDEDDHDWVTIPLIQHPVEEQRDHESDDDYMKRSQKAKWVCGRCWDELDEKYYGNDKLVSL